MNNRLLIIVVFFCIAIKALSEVKTYKFNDVFVQAENGDIIEQLPCYKKGLGLYRGNERG